MNKNKLPDYIGHIQQAATDACGFTKGLSKDQFFADRRTQNAVVMSLIVIGEASAKVMDLYSDFAVRHAEVCGARCGVCVTGSRTAILKSISKWFGIPSRRPCQICWSNSPPFVKMPTMKAGITTGWNHAKVIHKKRMSNHNDWRRS